jgi:hypothetical protein
MDGARIPEQAVSYNVYGKRDARRYRKRWKKS